MLPSGAEPEDLILTIMNRSLLARYVITRLQLILTNVYCLYPDLMILDTVEMPQHLHLMIVAPLFIEKKHAMVEILN